MGETTSIIAREIMDKSASLMNDTAKTVYTYTAQFPYLMMALDDLEMEFQLNNVAVTNKTGFLLPVDIGTEAVPIPGDLIEIQGIYERLFGNSVLASCEVAYTSRLRCRYNWLRRTRQR